MCHTLHNQLCSATMLHRDTTFSGELKVDSFYGMETCSNLVFKNISLAYPFFCFLNQIIERALNVFLRCIKDGSSCSSTFSRLSLS